MNGGHYQPTSDVSLASETFRWRADDGPTLNAGFVALRTFRGYEPVLLRNPIYTCTRPPPPQLDPRMDTEHRQPHASKNTIIDKLSNSYCNEIIMEGAYEICVPMTHVSSMHRFIKKGHR